MFTIFCFSDIFPSKILLLPKLSPKLCAKSSVCRKPRKLSRADSIWYIFSVRRISFWTFFYNSMLENEVFPLEKLSFINEEFYTLKVSPPHLDVLLANGWRHFGTQFFRYNLTFYNGRVCRVFPLRIRLSDFSLSKNKRRIIAKNQDLQIVVRPVEIDEEKEELFESHKHRFKHNIPFSIYDFLSFDAANIPCETLEVGVYREKNLIAASFFDVGETSVSSIYAMFAPAEASRSLGIFTMLAEIEFARKQGKDFYYQGYCYDEVSFYDYKKRFRALEKFDWKGNWESFKS